MNNIFVGNISFDATKEDLKKLFELYGSVADAKIMLGKKDKSRGYGFVDMPNEEEKIKAIADLNGKAYMGRELAVSVVVPKAKSEFKPKRREERKPRPTGNVVPLDKPPRKGRPTENNRPAKPWVKKSSGSTPTGTPRESKPWQKNKSFGKSPSSKTGGAFGTPKSWAKRPDKG